MHELLEDHWLCNPKDVELLSSRIKELIDDIDKYNTTSLRNYTESLEFEYGHLREVRQQFYSSISKESN